MRRIKVFLDCSPSKAREILEKNTSPAKGLRFFSIFAEPMFWAKFHENKAVIWPKVSKDLSATKMQLNIIPANDGTLITGKIHHYTIIKIPNWLLAISIVSFFFSFIGMVLLFLTLNTTFTLVLIIALLSFLIFYIGLMQRISEGQEEELEKFLNRVFNNFIK